MREVIAYARRRFREEVARWRDGVYESDVYVDHDPHGKKDIHVHCKVTVKGGDLTVDFTGSDDRPDIQAYSTFGNTRGYVVAQLASMMDPSIPKNEGFFDAIELIVPKGCCLNPPDGRSVAAGTHHPGTEVGEAIARALEQVAPDRTCPQVYKMGMPTVIFGTNPRDGKLFIDHSVDTLRGILRRGEGPGRVGRHERVVREPDPRHGGDQRGDLPGAPAGARLRDRLRRRRRVPRQLRQPLQEAGAGPVDDLHLRRRQALSRCRGSRAAVRDRPIACSSVPADPHVFEVGDTAGYIEHAAGESYEYHYGGGGGWGDPLDRPAERVLDDVLDEYVSVEAARREYGVVLTGSLEDLTLVDRPRRDGAAAGRAPRGALAAPSRVPTTGPPCYAASVRAHTEYLWFTTRQRRELINITERIAEIVAASGVQEGLCLVSAMHITAAIWVNDEESGLKQDVMEWLERIAPAGDYRHHQTGEDNADAHLKRTVVHHQVILPITKGALDLGPWEQVFYMEFDGRRKKRVVVKVIGA